MIANFTINPVYTTSEKFLAEKLLELFHYRTLDSYRARLNNPKNILKELNQVLSDLHHSKIKHFDKTIRPIIYETQQLLDDEKELIFNTIDKSYFKTLLGVASKDNYLQLSYAVKLVLEDNNAYCENLFKAIEEEIGALNAKGSDFVVSDLNFLSHLVDYVATELINLSYSKGYLYNIIFRLFGNDNARVFSLAFEEFRKLSSKSLERYEIIFKVIKISRKISLRLTYELDDEDIEELKGINEAANRFLRKENENQLFLRIENQGLDYLSVIQGAKKKLYSLLDAIHIGFPDNLFQIDSRCLVIGDNNRAKANTHPAIYMTDGHYKNNRELYELLSRKIAAISNKGIQKESLLKIVSALRHLRLGRDAEELEQKFINYWIGLEYIFSNYDIAENTITRLKNSFIDSHSLGYIKRNFKDYHANIKRLRVNGTIANYNDDLEYLKDTATYDFIIDRYFSQYPLLAFRAFKFKEMIADSKKIGEAILKHRKNLDWHFTRTYRIRNEIVHDAAIHLNIELITGNLKYYLTYILNSVIDYMDNTPLDINMDEKISIEDYFILQQIRYQSMHNSQFDLKKLLSEKSATEIFSQ